MTGITRYDRLVVAPRIAPRRLTAGLGVLAALAAFAFAPQRAAAETAPIEVADGAVVMLQAPGRSEISVRSWDRSSVSVQTESDETVDIAHRTAVFGPGRLPLGFAVPPIMWNIRRDTPAAASGIIPPEDFPFSNFRAGVHDVVHINAQPGAHLTVMVPASTGVLVVRGGVAQTAIDGFHGGNLIVAQGGGRVTIDNTATTAFVQLGGGALSVTDSAFERMRYRSIGASAFFERCRARQIETSTVTGTVVFDGGTFDPGLARFESQFGSIALGMAGDAQVLARSQQGHVYTQFDRRVAVEQRSESEASAVVGSGGPLVNALSGHGNVFLYDGTLRSRPNGRLPQQWRDVHRALAGHRVRQPAAQHPRR